MLTFISSFLFYSNTNSIFQTDYEDKGEIFVIFTINDDTTYDHSVQRCQNILQILMSPLIETQSFLWGILVYLIKKMRLLTCTQQCTSMVHHGTCHCCSRKEKIIIIHILHAFKSSGGLAKTQPKKKMFTICSGTAKLSIQRKQAKPPISLLFFLFLLLCQRKCKVCFYFVLFNFKVFKF